MNDRMRLYLATIPLTDEDGTCHRFLLCRPDGKHLDAADLNAVRVAFGQEPLDAEEVSAYRIRDWQVDA